MEIQERYDKLEEERTLCLGKLTQSKRASSSKSWTLLQRIEWELNFIENYDDLHSHDDLHDHRVGPEFDLKIEDVFILVDRINEFIKDSASDQCRCFAHDLFKSDTKFHELATWMDYHGIGNANHVMFRVTSYLNRR